MDVLKDLEQNRLSHGYVQRDFRRYKRFCNSNIRAERQNNAPGCLIFKLESNLTKFLLFDSSRFLYKNLRLLRSSTAKQINPDFVNIYKLYTQCFIESKKNEASFDMLLELRSYIADFYTFVTDISVMNDDKYDFSQHKVEHRWHDITLVFETKNMRDSFVNGDFSLSDNRFTTQLALLITRMDANIKALMGLISDNSVPLVRIFDVSRKTSTSAESLECFLDENFVESRYVKELHQSVDEVHRYISRLNSFRNGNLNVNLDDLPPLPHLEEYANILKGLGARKMVDDSRLRDLLLENIGKCFSVKKEERKLPLLPVFYDLAYDYITYPTDSSTISGIFKKFSLFTKK